MSIVCVIASFRYGVGAVDWVLWFSLGGDQETMTRASLVAHEACGFARSSVVVPCDKLVYNERILLGNENAQLPVSVGVLPRSSKMDVGQCNQLPAQVLFSGFI